MTAFVPSALAHSGHVHDEQLPPPVGDIVVVDATVPADAAPGDVVVSYVETAQMPVVNRGGSNCNCDYCAGFAGACCGTFAIASEAGETAAFGRSLPFHRAGTPNLRGLVPEGPPRPPRSFA